MINDSFSKQKKDNELTAGKFGQANLVENLEEMANGTIDVLNNIAKYHTASKDEMRNIVTSLQDFFGTTERQYGIKKGYAWIKRSIQQQQTSFF